MLRSLNELTHLPVKAADGRAGSVEDFLIDAESGKVGFIVVETGQLLGSQSKLVSAQCISPPASIRELPFLGLELSLKQLSVCPEWGGSFQLHSPEIADSTCLPDQGNYLTAHRRPPVDQDAPVAYRFTGSVHSHALNSRGSEPAGSDATCYLAARRLWGSEVLREDDIIGTLTDMLVEDADWEIRQLLVEMREWLSSNRLCLPFHWLQKLDYKHHRLELSVPSQEMESLLQATS
ncbi:MAG: hypothetical protein KJT03_20230 [Verrucomicrobiae bacterium]|nr:hypothetical protein [Verrucomicrobiae bacterium]